MITINADSSSLPALFNLNDNPVIKFGSEILQRIAAIARAFFSAIAEFFNACRSKFQPSSVKTIKIADPVTQKSESPQKDTGTDSIYNKLMSCAVIIFPLYEFIGKLKTVNPVERDPVPEGICLIADEFNHSIMANSLKNRLAECVFYLTEQARRSSYGATYDGCKAGMEGFRYGISKGAQCLRREWFDWGSRFDNVINIKNGFRFSRTFERIAKENLIIGIDCIAENGGMMCNTPNAGSALIGDKLISSITYQANESSGSLWESLCIEQQPCQILQTENSNSTPLLDQLLDGHLEMGSAQLFPQYVILAFSGVAAAFSAYKAYGSFRAYWQSTSETPSANKVSNAAQSIFWGGLFTKFAYSGTLLVLKSISN